MSTTTENISSATSRALVQQIRNRWELVQARWVAVPEQLRRAWDQVGERVRNALDLPTKQELEILGRRLDEIDARLQALASRRTAERPEAAETARAPGLAPETASAAEPTLDAKAPGAERAGEKTVAEKRVRKKKSSNR